MAGTPTSLPFDHNGCVTTSVELASRWTTVIDYTDTSHGLFLYDGSADGTDITNPDGITDANKHPLVREGRASVLRLRMAYTGTITVEPIVQVFGRTKKASDGASDQVWQGIRNLQDSLAVQIDKASNDLNISGTKYTDPHPAKHAWNCEGFDEILVGVKTKFQGSGSPTASLQARMYTA